MLLPEADKVMVINEAHEVVAHVAWSRLREVAGGRMEPTDEYPPRWLVRSFPDGAELAALGEVADSTASGG